MKTTDPVRNLEGVGPKREAALIRHNVCTVNDLLGTLPVAYQDRRQRGTLQSESDMPVTTEAEVVKKGTILRMSRKLSLFVLPVEEINDEGHVIRGEAIWFNQPWLQTAFEIDRAYLFYGKIRQKGRKMQILNPQFAPADHCEQFFKITPVYPKLEGIPPESLRKLIVRVLNEDLDVNDAMPASLIEKFGLLSMREVYQNLHCPENREGIESAKERLKFEEALKINLGILQNRNPDRNAAVRIHHFSQLKRFEAGLPFALTTGQISVLEDIVKDLKENKMINRLILGDVGSGKTVIAMACAFLFALGGYQSAYMAPTEILAEQHAENFRKILSPYGIDVALLTGSMKGKEKKDILDKISRGDIQVIIGTHALIQNTVDYYQLGLVITDEQHRFGVKQRGRLSLKGRQPHTIVMSATPIPRTLSLVFYGDLDVSVINVMPKGRKKIKTFFYGEKYLPKIYDFMLKEIEKGYQAMVVCPFIDLSEEMDEVRDVGRVYDEMSAYFTGRCKAASLHSKMSADEKQAVISDFYEKKTDVLVSTSIVEVGIDVRDVSVMVIMSADRFGLSQLHQLRGRAGRGNQQAYCFLVSNARGERTIERMKVIVNHHNGQEIAEEDYRLRGPGDYFGCRQHGFPDLKALDPYQDMALIKETRHVAEEILSSKKADMMNYRSKVLETFINETEISMN